jgi:mRNA interferase RelE/StbE
MPFTVFLTKAAIKDLAAIPKQSRQRIDHILRSLENNPRPHGSIKLQGIEDSYRIRKGDLRIIYRIEDEALAVTVARVGNRRDVYRDLLG